MHRFRQIDSGFREIGPRFRQIDPQKVQEFRSAERIAPSVSKIVLTKSDFLNLIV